MSLRSPKFARVAIGVATALCVAAAAPRVHAQTAEQAGITPTAANLGPSTGALAAVLTLVSLLPGEGGADVSVGSLGLRNWRGLIAWPFQIPLPLRDRSGTITYTHHRIVISPAIAIGHQDVTVEGTLRSADVVFVGRIGYRYVRHLRGSAFGGLVGLGHTADSWPIFRPSIGVEMGLHLGACCGEATFIGTIVARADFFFALDDRVRLSLAGGWAFY